MKGGEYVNESLLPYTNVTCSIEHKNVIKGVGFFITSNLVVTAASILFERKCFLLCSVGKKLVKTEYLQVRFGMNEPNMSTFLLNVEKIHIDDNYNPKSDIRNVAVLLVSSLARKV